MQEAPAADSEAGAAEKSAQTLEQAEQALEQALSELSTAGTDCERVCKALGSMRRSATRICALDGAGGPRCERAQSKLDAAEERVRGSCGGC